MVHVPLGGVTSVRVVKRGYAPVELRLEGDGYGRREIILRSE